jgi:hypothetical protein
MFAQDCLYLAQYLLQGNVGKQEVSQNRSQFHGA